MPLIPASQAVFLALMYVFVKLCDRFDKLFGTIIFARGSEVIEFFIYYYIMSYIVSFDIQPFSREAGQ